MTSQNEALLFHLKHRGKLEIKSKVDLSDKNGLSLAYTPGVAIPCQEIARDKDTVYKYTSKWNMVAVISDGTAVLGLGDIGPEAALPVMEGKAILFKQFAGVDAFPICIGTQDANEIVKLIKNLEPTFGGINLEDIAAPKCFEIEDRLKKILDIPVFHDDQHGTAIVVLAGLLNALKLTGKNPENITVVINGTGSAGIAIARLLLNNNIGDIIMCDLQGVVHKDAQWLNPAQKDISLLTNKRDISGNLKDALIGADVFIGVSGPGALNKEFITNMASKPIIFAMANPVPEIMPEEAIASGAFIVATGRSDFPNQINNLLAFPGIFRGALDVRAREITNGMKLAAAKAISRLIPEEQLHTDFIIPDPFDKRVASAVAKEVAKTAVIEKMARVVPEYLSND